MEGEIKEISMKEEEKVQCVIDAFPELYDALVLYSHSEGYVGINKYVRNEIKQLIEFITSSWK